VQPDELSVGAVGRAVVDEDKLPVEIGAVERLDHL